MQMAVTSSKPIPLPQKPMPELTEEERMAKKREYWRVKKREQRAARATRQKQGPAHGRGNAAFQKRRNQKAMSNRRAVVTKPNVNIAVRPKLNIQVLPDPSEIKQEILSASPNDLNCESGLPLIMDIKIPPLSPPVPQETQPEPDPALSAETQATTLLAVASMKKLLEESLSTVTETESQQTNTSCEQLPCKIEAETCPTEEEDSKQDMKPQLPLLSLEGEEEKVGEEKVGHEVEVASMAADQPLEVTGWQKVAEALPTCQVAIGPLSPDLKVLPLSSELSSLSACTQTLSPPGPALPPSETPPHTASCTHGTNAGAALPTNTDARSSERLRVKKIRQQHCCSPQPNEPGKLHHPPLLQQQSQPAPQPRTQPQPQPRPRPQPRPQPKPQPAPEPVHQPHTFGPEKNMTLEKKREYWKIMKRQQRARSKARQRGESFKQGDYSRRLALKVAQSPNLCIMKTQKPVAPTALQASPPPLLPKPSAPILQPISAPISGAHASLTAVANIPTVLVVSPTMATLGQPPDTLQVKPPISSAPRSPQQVGLNAGTLQNSPGFSGASLPATGAGKEARLLLVENKQEVAPGSSPDSPRVRKWSLQVQDVVDHDDIAPIPTLTPPANPLASIKLLPIQPSPPFRLPPMARPNANSTPYGSAQSGDKRSRVPQWFPTSTLGPPKPIPGESEEETLRRKREYWRVKKKEQRARKAMGDKRPPVANWAPPILPPQASVQGLDTQDLGQWVNAEDGSGLLLNSSSETELDYSNVDYTAPIEDEADIIYPDGGENMDDCEISEAVWRHRYLMDHDPLNQLLVCMVCGDLQYTHSLEGVRAHIEEAHPETLALEAPERRRILDAWDEQVSQRERFFTSQLQQHGGPLAGDSSNLPAEVVVDTEET